MSLKDKSRRDFLKNAGKLVFGAFSLSALPKLSFSSLAYPDYIKPDLKPQKKIAITIDDGWFDREKIVHITDYYNVPVTMFIIGKVIHEDPKPWIKAIEKGHEIGCHTFYHGFFSRETEEKILDDFSLYEKTFLNKLGKDNYQNIKHFRYPYGDTGNKITRPLVEKLVQDKGWKVAWWDLDLSFMHRPRFSDYKSPTLPFDKFKIYMEENHEKTIVLLHFKYPDWEVLPRIIEYSLQNNIKMVKLSEL